MWGCYCKGQSHNKELSFSKKRGSRSPSSMALHTVFSISLLYRHSEIKDHCARLSISLIPTTSVHPLVFLLFFLTRIKCHFLHEVFPDCTSQYRRLLKSTLY